MAHPAGELVRGKQGKIKPLTSAEALGRHNGRDQLIAEIGQLASSVHFHLTDQTLWAYRMVEHFLDVGWEVQQYEINFRTDCIISVGEFGRAMDAIIGRTCYDRREAIRTNAVWTQAGPYPSRADLGAVLFYCFMTP